jgi:hypothetical protein
MNCVECGNPKIKVKKDQLCSGCVSRKWRKENPDKYRAGQDRFYKENRDKLIADAIAWNKANPEQYKKNRQEWEKVAKPQTVRYHNDLNFRLRKLLRTRLLQSIRTDQKKGSAVSDLGCSIEEFKRHLESKFYTNTRTGEVMSWDNIGEWHLDHVLPLASFDLADRDQFLKACYYTNIQPLWKEENLKKSDFV